MATAKFKIGDQVVLKSGGPPMTIDSIGTAGGVYAAWFAGAKHERAHFHEDTLEPAPPKAAAKKAEV